MTRPQNPELAVYEETVFIVDEDLVMGSMPQGFPLEACLVCRWENFVRKAGLLLGMINPSGKCINVGWRLGRDSKGGPISSLVPGLNRDTDQRTRIKQVPDVCVPQGLNTWIVGDVHGRQSWD